MVRDIIGKNIKLTEESHVKVKIGSKLKEEINEIKEEMNRLRKQVGAKKEITK